MKYEIRLIAFVYLREDGIIVSVRRVLFLLVRLVYMKKKGRFSISAYTKKRKHPFTRTACGTFVSVRLCVYIVYSISMFRLCIFAFIESSFIKSKKRDK